MLRHMWLSFVVLFSVGQAFGQFVWHVPQVVDGENAPDDTEHFFRSEFTFVNFSGTAAVDVVLTLRADDGSAFSRLRSLHPVPGGGTGSGASFTLPARGSLTLRTTNGPFRIVGWGTIEATGEIGVVVTLQYLVSGTGEVTTSTSLIPEAPLDAFSTVALIGPRASTGVALINPSDSESSEVLLSLYSANGTLFDTRTIELGPGAKIAQFLNEGDLFASLDEFSGSIEVVSRLPLAATVIRVDADHWSTFPIFAQRPGD